MRFDVVETVDPNSLPPYTIFMGIQDREMSGEHVQKSRGPVELTPINNM